MPIRPLLRWCTAAGLALAALAPAARASSRPAMIPSLVLKTSTGQVALDSLRGKVVLVDFWASWCGPCHQSFPWLDAVQKRYADSGLVVVAVSVDKSLDAADAFLARHPGSMTVAYDPAGRAAQAFDVHGMPSTYLIGRDGSIRMSHVGFDPRKVGPLEAGIQEACRR